MCANKNKISSPEDNDKSSPIFSYKGYDPLAPSGAPELVIGIVGPAGVDRSKICKIIISELEEYNYQTKKIKLSSLMSALPGFEKVESDFEDECDRIDSLMNAGNNLREITSKGDALALLAIAKIQDIRESLNKKEKLPSLDPREKTAYILDSLKHPDEISTLRATYGQGFILVSAHASRGNRIENLARRISNSRKNPQGVHSARSDAEYLITRDEKEESLDFGQNVQSCFPKADFFVDLDSKEDKLSTQIDRLFQIIFGNPFITPTRDEWGMFHAEAASWRSADLARQVGSSICGDDGEIIALGCNDVPKALGGLYWEGDTPDGRDFQYDSDQGAELKRLMLAEVFNRLKERGNFDTKAKETLSGLVEKSINGTSDPVLDGLQALNVIEYGRTVHAEMAALTDAVSKGASVKNSTMYVNTFPCHICARHIISSGVKRLVFIEPYPKSFTNKLFKDSISGSRENNGLVIFEPFIGVAPRMYQFAFKLITKRKNKSGEVVEWKKNKAKTKLKRFVTSYMAIENQIVSNLVPTIVETVRGIEHDIFKS
ncbi:anti-phage dCTP deaminase [Idiomarina baltica]|uniref:Probable Cytidine deaminase n=1 Tax=Idiomarina baltica OS145 TaxID=314276 RepID=A0ABM9WKY0_9GAMM|nr:anti-phage dCTP deaminase [Idiomarina baltica]EAQ31547.1 probable Cytidine deaminase [Idiomarina baltica OS145]